MNCWIRRSYEVLRKSVSPSYLWERNDRCIIGSRITFLRGRAGQTEHKVAYADLVSQKQIFSLCRALQTPVILPIDLSEQKLVSDQARWLKARSIRFLSNDWRVIALCHNKRLFSKELIRRGFGAYLPRNLETIEFPCIMKRSEDCWGEHTFLIQCRDDIRHAEEKLGADDFIVQEYIHGNHEFASHILSNRGELIWISTNRYSHEKEYYRKGIHEAPILTELVETDPLALGVFKGLLKSFSYSGFCCFDYKITHDGELRIFEMNPRMGGSLAMHRELFPEIVERYRIEALRAS